MSLLGSGLWEDPVSRLLGAGRCLRELELIVA